MSVEQQIGEDSTPSGLYNPSVKIGDTVFTQDLVHSDLNLPLEVYHNNTYIVAAIRPVGGIMGVVLISEGEKLVVPLDELMEHGIVDYQRLTVASSNPEKIV